LLAASLGLLYAVLVPPLMAPDEPYHMLGFAELASDRALAADTVAWMGETHLWRIRQQPSERFRSIDVGRPYVQDDDQLRATEVAMRSAVLARLWQAARPLLVERKAPGFLLRVRLLNVLLWSAAMAAATAFAVAAVDEPFRSGSALHSCSCRRCRSSRCTSPRPRCSARSTSCWRRPSPCSSSTARALTGRACHWASARA
jgi:hypothetical protein